MRYNGRDFSDFGVHVDESKAFGSPEKDYELIEVVGRNGNLSIYNDRFKDIVLSFPCFIRSGFIEKYRNLLAYLNSLDGYQRLETEKEPNHFRKALFTGSVDVQTTPWNQGGFFTINFSCLPQRFLKSGENWTTVSSSSSEISGNPVSVDNPSGLTALTGLSVDLEPVQDLNGYDHPWVGGAGQNVLDPNIKFTSGTYNGITLTTTDGYTYTRTGTATSSGNVQTNAIALADAVLLPAGTYTSVGGIFSLYKADGSFLGNKQIGTWTVTEPFFVKNIYFQTVTGRAYNDTTFIALAKGSTAPTEWSPYENICPISGHTSATVMRTGKNLLPNLLYQQNSAIVVLGQSDSSSFGLFLKAGTYTISAKSTSAWAYYYRTENGTSNIHIGGYNTTQATFTLEEDTKLRIYAYLASGLNAEDISEPQLEEGTEATAYEPYQGQTVTVDLNGTVYGGTLDVSTGVLTLTKGVKIYDGTETWRAEFTYNFYAGTGRGTGKYDYDCKCSHLKYNGINGNSTDTSKMPSGYISAGGYFNIQTADIEHTAEAMQAWCLQQYQNGTPLTVVFDLATPTTVQLTAQQVSLLTGTNIISTDMANMTVTIASPAELENLTLFESKPLIRVYGNGTLNVNDIYITVANSPYTYIDIDCELMDCYHGSNNANQYVSFSTTDYVTLRSGMNYFSYSGFTKVEVTPRWFEV